MWKLGELSMKTDDVLSLRISNDLFTIYDFASATFFGLYFHKDLLILIQ